MFGDTYDVLPLLIKISDEIRKQNPHFKPFVAVYIPAGHLSRDEVDG